ncbi:MAG: flagellar basal-body MS-ring/collar protein FliF [Granulosicoccus sp.]
MSDATINNGQAGSPLTAALARFFSGPQLGALVVVATALTLGAGLISWTLKPEFVPVAEQGGRADALQIIESLKASAIEYKLDPSTGLVLVPKDKYAEIQMNLAASGLTSSKSAQGLELLQNESALGTSHFTESARYQHALETELSRTITSMRNVESARVHLAMPKQSVFIRDREMASASVMVKAMAGRTLEDEQVDAIINLVASSIPYLGSEQVTIVDQWGRLLSSGDDSTSGATRDQFQYARKLEKLYADRIETLLTPIIGAGRVRAIVTTDVDFSVNEQTQESFEPDAAQLRSEQVDTQINRNGGAAIGIPGALTNQPPGNGTTDAEIPGADGTSTQAQNESSSAIKNYELDKTITHTRRVPGTIRRVSAAVLIDDKISFDDAGETIRTPLTEEELAQYKQLAQEAVGFSEERGDSVVVINRSFQPMEEIAPIEPLPIWEQSWLWTMVRQVLTGLSVLLLVLLVLRPAMKKLMSGGTEAELAALGHVPTADGAAGNAKGLNDALGNSLEQGGEARDWSSNASSAALDAPPVVYGDILNMARAMAAEDPKRVAKVVKDWVAEQ